MELAAAWYSGLAWESLGHQVELDAGTQLALVGVVATVAVRREFATATAGCCAVHAEEVVVCLVEELAAALEAEGAPLALGVAAEQAAMAAGFIEIQVGLHVLVVGVLIIETLAGSVPLAALMNLSTAVSVVIAKMAQSQRLTTVPAAMAAGPVRKTNAR
jgi:hypothetical protein